MPLVVCATPIGNLEDVTLRVLRELREADLVLCEDTRRTRVLLGHYGIDAKLLSYERHSEARRTAEIIPRLEQGERIALVSDAGLPGVNDPGARLIDEVLARELEVTVLPGPSAVETALVASGLGGGRYVFVGYVPRAAAARSALWQELAGWGVAAGRLRVAEAAAGHPGESRRTEPGPAGHRVPRAHQAVRADTARNSRGSGAAVHGACEG